MSLDPFAEYDAAYVLGSLSPDERRAFEEHMAGCPSCREAVRELAGMPGLLARVPAEDVLAPQEAPPPALLRGLVERARAHRRRRLVRSALAAAAAVAVLAGGGVVVATAGHDDTSAPSAGAPMSRLVATPLHVHARMVDVAWGTKVQLTCTYNHATAYSVDPHSYQLVVVDHAGHRQQIATWSAVPGRVSHVTGATSWKRSDIASVEVRTPSGQPVLTLNS